MVKILISQGHGAGKAHNRGGLCFNEGDNNFYYSEVLKRELLKYNGVTVDMVRKIITDNPSVNNRAKMGKGYDLYLSVHSNAGDSSVRGTEVFDSIERPNKTLAQSLVDATSNFFKHRNRGVKYREGSKKGFNYYGELRFNEAKSAMIVENGFHTNPVDCAMFKNGHNELAKIQAKVIADFYQLKLKTDKKPIDLTIPSPWAKEDWELATRLKLTDGDKPKALATREMTVTILDRYFKVCQSKKLGNKNIPMQNPIVRYSDQPSNWAKKDWEWGISTKITAGNNPKDNITREELIAMIIRHYKLMGGQ